MPHLKVQDIKEQLELAVKTLNEKFDGLVEEVKTVLADSGVNIGENTTSKLDEEIAKLKKELDNLRKDMAGHVNLYNKHIIEQHKPRKK